MKHVISVSLGSKSGDFSREIVLDGQALRLEREGTDGDINKAIERIHELDGHVDAIGLGGIDIYLYVGGEQFIIGDGLRISKAATITPVLDGSGLKDTLERRVISKLADRGLIAKGTRVLMVSAMDRFGMAEAFVELGCDCVFGDLIFDIGLDYPLKTLKEIHEIAVKYRSRLLTAPFNLLYPTGSAQDTQDADPKYAKYYDNADIIAGDGHLILRHLPSRAEGKGIVTNTTRPKSIARFTDSGVAWIVTTTPDLDGVSAGTNLMEAAFVALSGKSPAQITAGDYDEFLNRVGWSGSFHSLGNG